MANISGIDTSIITFLVSVGASFGVAMWRINSLTKNQDKSDGAIKAIGSKLDDLRNEVTKLHSEIDKDVHFLKREVEIIKKESLKKEHLDECVRKHECSIAMGKKADKDELDLKLQIIKKDIEHLTIGIEEVKNGMELVLKYLSKGGVNDRKINWRFNRIWGN